jgi:hypothetical protein
MKKYLTLIAITLFAFGLIGCSKQAQGKAAAPSKVYDLGVVEISDGIQTKHDLGDGRVCAITPALQKDGSMILNMRLEESGRLVTKFRVQFDKSTTGFTMRDGDFSIAMKPRIKQ